MAWRFCIILGTYFEDNHRFIHIQPLSARSYSCLVLSTYSGSTFKLYIVTLFSVTSSSSAILSKSFVEFRAYWRTSSSASDSMRVQTILLLKNIQNTQEKQRARGREREREGEWFKLKGNAWWHNNWFLFYSRKSKCREIERTITPKPSNSSNLRVKSRWFLFTHDFQKMVIISNDFRF